jgi:hypothetical protein
MKLLPAILVFLLTFPPVQAGFCDMDQGTGDAQHASMQHGDGGKHDTQPTGHDCCGSPGDGGRDDADSDCGNMLQCGACVAGLAALTATVTAAAAPLRTARVVAGTEALAPSHGALPYRPPISLS